MFSNKTPEEKARERAAKQAKREARIKELDAKQAEREARIRELDAKMADLDRKMHGLRTGTWPVKEGGRNGVVEVSGPTIKRTFKKVMGRDDTTTIPLRMVASVHVDRRGLGTDVVTVSTTGGERFEWKTSGAQAIADAIAKGD